MQKTVTLCKSIVFTLIYYVVILIKQKLHRNRKGRGWNEKQMNTLIGNSDIIASTSSVIASSVEKIGNKSKAILTLSENNIKDTETLSSLANKFTV